MNPVEAATKILDTMLGHLGFAAQIEVEDRDEGPCLQILSSQSDFLIGRDGYLENPFEIEAFAVDDPSDRLNATDFGGPNR